jgi:hypothetical protein
MLWHLCLIIIEKAGKWRHYHNGQYLMNRYKGFLSETYDPAEVHVRASDIDRTIMSAQSSLLGMYPPIGNQKWNPDIPAYQPIAVHTVPPEKDMVYIVICTFLYIHYI